MRRLPIYLLIDCSESMAGDAMEAVQMGLSTMVATLRSDPHALETAFLSVITFASSARQIVPLTELTQFQSPPLAMGSGTALGAALTMLQNCLNNELRKTSAEMKGDYLPICFLLTDGEPTDSWQGPADKIKSLVAKRKVTMIAVACGPDADASKLKRITDDVLMAGDVSKETFKRILQWVSSSVSTASQSIERSGTGNINLDKLPTEFVKKASEEDFNRIGQENRFAFLHMKCVKTKQFFIARYQRGENGGDDAYHGVAAHKVENFDLSSSEESGGAPQIASSLLQNAPLCPDCGNPIWAMCSCGHTHCSPPVGVMGVTLTCPWCNVTNTYTPGYFKVGQGRG